MPYLKDVNGGLMNCADYCPAGQHSVLDCPHNDGRRSGIQPRGGLLETTNLLLIHMPGIYKPVIKVHD